MEATEGKRRQKRVNVPSTAEQDVIQLTVQLLSAKSGTVFGRGFRLRALGRRLYVQLSGVKVPLYLDFDSPPMEVQNRGYTLRSFLLERDWQYDSDAWRDACAVSRVKKGKPPERRLRRESVIDNWYQLKRVEGVSEVTLRRTHLPHLLRLDERNPLSQESLLKAIGKTEPSSVVRRRVVPLLRRVCALHGVPWNSALLDPLQNSGMPLSHRPQAFFKDEEIEALLAPESPLNPSYRRVVALMAVYGLRPWEAWFTEPCKQMPGCVWVSKGKKNSRGTNPPRQVPPFHREWLELFEMERLWRAPLPQIGRHSDAAKNVNQTLRRSGLVPQGGPTSYGFRHAYARRLHSSRYRVLDVHAALFMGHTVLMHCRTYRNWLGEENPISLYLERPG